MATVPKGLSEKVAFFQTRLESITANAAALGLTSEDVATLQEQVDAAREALREQYAAQSIARSKTSAANQAVRVMAHTGATIIETIRATAAQTDDPTLYNLAQIPSRAKRSPIEVPGTPACLNTTLRVGDGSLLLKWTCENPRGSTGTVYQVYRSVAGEPYVYLATVGEKKFVDETIPKAATQLAYKIQATRSTKVGAAAMFNVSFGTNGAEPLPRRQIMPRRAIAPSLAA